MVVQNGMTRIVIASLGGESDKKAVQLAAEHGDVRFGVEREDGPGSVEDFVDIIAKHGARLNSLQIQASRRTQSSGRVRIHVTASDVDGNITTELLEELRGLGEILYFQSFEWGSG